MKSSRRADLTALVLVAVSTLVIAAQGVTLNRSFKKIKQGADAFLLPGVEQTYVASLGYRSALADLIYGHVLVSYGLHFDTGHLYRHVGDYLDVVNRLDPQFRAPYWFADTLLTLQPQAPPLEFYRKARQIQERGLKNLPFDQGLWAASGQFLAYLAPQHLSDAKEQEEYRQTGARYLLQACNLVGSNDAIPYHCVTAARLLDERGNREAARSFLVRLQTMSDDPAILALAGSYLSKIAGEAEQAKAAARQQRFRARWQADWSGAPRVEAGALGPRFGAAACAGVVNASAAECAASWRTWSEQQDATTEP